MLGGQLLLGLTRNTAAARPRGPIMDLPRAFLLSFVSPKFVADTRSTELEAMCANGASRCR